MIRDLNVGVLVQGPSSEIIVANAASLHMLGLSEEQLLGKTSIDPDWNVIHEDGSPFPGPTHPVPTAIATRKPVRNVVMGVYRPDTKNRVWLSVNAEPVLNEDGSIKHVLCTFYDITDLRETQQQLLRAQKMDALGQMAGAIAHEFNNILTAQISYAELLETAAAEPEKVASYASQIQEVAWRGVSVAKQLLAFARKKQTATAPFVLASVLRDLEEMLVHLFPRNIRIQLALSLSDECVTGDPALLQQALLNLCLNARDAMPHGGDLHITARRAPAGSLEIQIADTGIGMTDEVRAKIFEPFFTTKERGTGLGLSVVAGIIANHNGKIEVKSAPGKGTSIHLILPEGKGAKPAPVARIVPSRGRGEVVLIVDDELAIRTALAEYLWNGISVRNGGGRSGGAENLRDPSCTRSRF